MYRLFYNATENDIILVGILVTPTGFNSRIFHEYSLDFLEHFRLCNKIKALYDFFMMQVK